MTKSTWDDFAPLAPLDRVAGAVTSKGVHYDPNLLESTVHSLTPLPVRKVSDAERKDPTFKDYTGVVIGRLKVTGPAKDVKRSNSGSAWVVRCVCGHYEHRRSKSIKRYLEGRNTGDASARCSECSRTASLATQHRRPAP